MKGREHGWVERALKAAYRSGRLAAVFDRMPAGDRANRLQVNAEQPGARPAATRDDGWHH